MAASKPIHDLAQLILTVRYQRVILDADLAALYDVPTKMLNQAVRRNEDRFPAEFMFQLGAKELAILRSQIVTSSSHGGLRTRPFVFTEHGVLMAAQANRRFASSLAGGGTVPQRGTATADRLPKVDGDR